MILRKGSVYFWLNVNECVSTGESKEYVHSKVNCVQHLVRK